MKGKREAVSRLCAAAGITWLLEHTPRRPVLMILNYHRVGDRRATAYDPNLFSATAEEFDWQIGYLKQHFRMTTLAEVLALVEGADRLAEPRLLVTFDDGYRDNYQVAYPLLRRHGVQGVFFLPTGFAGSARIPWWDEIAFLVKHSERERFRLEYPRPQNFDLAAAGVERTIAQVLDLYKEPETREPARFIDALERACGCSRPGPQAERCFLDWNEAREMQAGGMVFGSHTHGHEILSKLPLDEQIAELRVSREILEKELGRTVDTLAYPVGKWGTFSEHTIEALRKTGYRAAFSFYSGFNTGTSIPRFDIKRCGVDRQSRGRLRLQTALGSHRGNMWF